MRRTLVVAALLALTACGGGASRNASSTTTTSNVTSSTTMSTTTTVASAVTTTTRRRAATTTTAHQSSVHRVSDADNGKTITVVVGDRVLVTLDSTYWQIGPASDPAVLRKDGDTAYAPSGNCVPGGGCGTATADFIALGAGHARISASRTSCGEAMRCTGGAGSFFVDVNVTN